MTCEFALLGTCVHMPYPLAIQVFAAGVLLPMEMLLVQWNGIVIIVSIIVVIVIILSVFPYMSL
jgi:cytochrome b subunit of formate dehydrogenase